MALRDSLVDCFRKLTGTQSTIRRAIAAISGFRNIKIEAADNNGGMLLVPWFGALYHVYLISNDDQKARISVESHIRFPAGRLPRDVCSAIDEMNTHMQNCYYDAIYCDNHSAFVVRTWVNIPDISPQAFMHWFSNLVAPLQTLDRLLSKYGYPR